MSVADTFELIQQTLPDWTSVYVDQFYQDIIDAGFNRSTIRQAFGLAQIVENVGPITLRGAFYRAVSEGFFPDTSDAHYRAAGNIVLKLRRRHCISYSKIVDSTRRRLKPSAWSGLDHDPSGLRIEQCLRKKLSEYSGRDFLIQSWRRIGINSADFGDQSVLGFPIKGDRHSRSWQTKHRDYLGQFGDRCVEIDALHPDTIRERLREAIESHIDQDQWNALKAVEAIERNTIEQFVLAQKGAAA